MSTLRSNAMLLLYGCGTILLLLTLLIPLEPSGGSMIQKNESIILRSTTKR